MKKTWIDPAKQTPKPETMNTPGDFKAFTELMRKIVEKPKPHPSEKVAVWNGIK